MTLTNRNIIGLVSASAIVAALTVTFLPRDPEPAPQATTAPTATASRVQETDQPSLQLAIEQNAPAALRGELDKMYAENRYRPLWTDNRAGRKRLAAIDDVTQILAAQDIDGAVIVASRSALASAKSSEERVQAELRLSAALLRAAKGQRFGFVSAKDLGWNLMPDQAEIAAPLGAAAADGDLGAFFESLRPGHPQYQTLTDALVRYRQIVAAGGWPQVPDGKEIDFAADPRLPALRLRLIAEGYLPADAGSGGETLRDGLKLYQAHNGLEPDGRAGKATLGALNVPAEERVAQIAANLERWRHMRHEQPEDYVVANVADQTVAVIRGGREDLRLRTVVGSLRHATPMLEAKLTAVTINPPWEIPTSIITNEILPKLDVEPSYLIDNGMDVVGGNWDNPKSLRMRQRPGAGNSLGHIKFQMQNEWNIYLHDTPSQSLFAKDERYFSHGCVRVHQPQELAANLVPSWDAAVFDELVASGETRTLKLEKALPVFVLYWTVFADQDGQLQFRRDAYKRDETTVAALNKAGLLNHAPEVAQAGN